MTETLTKLSTQPGDIIVVTLGGNIDGREWIPSREDIQSTAEEWAAILPDGVECIVTHQFQKVDIIHPVSCTTWPPKVTKHA